jgi:hypothetical protein
MKTGISVVLFVVAVFGFFQSVAAQIIPDSSSVRALTEARSLKCSFPWYASTDWDGDQPTIKSANQPDFGFQIDGIDLRKGSARIIGNKGANDITASQGMGSVSFIERVPVGNLNVTTVYAWRDRMGRFKAVHSRHTAIGGPSPSQNYGYCQIWQ